ncbi:hypothetical protein WMW72_26145 [Paenibacillus filicis]|uniref:Uncharacterized protein n=1 Tax=Paenibacillus filicis TaxID=669464 RepID=A0ABU9DRB4_9BACL
MEIIEYHVKTKCGRNFVWSAPDMDYLFRSLTFRGYTAVEVMTLDEYERQQADRQIEWNYHLKREVEEGRKAV